MQVFLLCVNCFFHEMPFWPVIRNLNVLQKSLTFGEELYFKYNLKITKLKCVAVFFTAHSLKGFTKTLALLLKHTSKLLSDISKSYPSKQQ